MDNIENSIKEFLEYQDELSLIGNAISVLHFDMSTVMPEKGVKRRSEVLSYLSGLNYKLENNSKYKELVKNLFHNIEKLNDKEKAMVKKAKKSLDFMTKIPEKEYMEYSLLISGSEKVWENAREKNDYKLFKDTLEKIVDFNKKIADYVGYEDTPYDALLDDYEPGMTVEDIDEVFKELRDGLVDLLEKIKKSDVKLNKEDLFGDFPVEPQREYSKKIARMFGFDFTRGIVSESVHPFTTNFGNDDVRITTAYSEKDPITAIYSTIHESGHAIYEQNIPDSITNTNIGGGVSMGIHESQSRFYENILGRSEEFLNYIYDSLTDTFPDFKKFSKKEFYKNVNAVEPSLIRVDADELTYSIHIIIRYEIEKMLINGEVDFDQLPKIWADKYTEYLGVTPKDDKEGVLQDIHWAGGSIGYFPTYALGNLYGAQILYKGILRDIPNFYDLVEKGEIALITEWLNEHIHKYGGIYEPKVLLEKITGESLSPKYFLKYLNDKYSKIYNL